LHKIRLDLMTSVEEVSGSWWPSV